jgi:hypothetical protein
MRTVTFKQYDEIVDIISDIRIMAGIVSDSADEIQRDKEGDDWMVAALHGERIAHFALKVVDDVQRLRDLVNAQGGEA